MPVSNLAANLGAVAANTNANTAARRQRDDQKTSELSRKKTTMELDEWLATQKERQKATKAKHEQTRAEATMAAEQADSIMETDLHKELAVNTVEGQVRQKQRQKDFEFYASIQDPETHREAGYKLQQQGLEPEEIVQKIGKQYDPALVKARISGLAETMESFNNMRQIGLEEKGKMDRAKLQESGAMDRALLQRETQLRLAMAQSLDAQAALRAKQARSVPVTADEFRSGFNDLNTIKDVVAANMAANEFIDPTDPKSESVAFMAAADAMALADAEVNRYNQEAHKYSVDVSQGMQGVPPTPMTPMIELIQQATRNAVNMQGDLEEYDSGEGRSTLLTRERDREILMRRFMSDPVIGPQLQNQPQEQVYRLLDMIIREKGSAVLNTEKE
jgi:hypothetical protein